MNDVAASPSHAASSLPSGLFSASVTCSAPSPTSAPAVGLGVQVAPPADDRREVLLHRVGDAEVAGELDR